MPVIYRAEKDPALLLQNLEAICTIADGDKEALGFLPEAAYRDAIVHRRLVAMLARQVDKSEVAGFILFGGVFPHARIQQVGVAPAHRRSGVASALVNDLISQLEDRGYLTITAAVASDLSIAHGFYARNGFLARHSRSGGVARKRTIVLRVRDLDTASFLPLLGMKKSAGADTVDLGLLPRSASQARFTPLT